LYLFGSARKEGRIRERLKKKSVERPLSYLEVVDHTNQRVEIDFNYLRHPILNVKALEHELGRAGTDLVVLERLDVRLPKEVILEEGRRGHAVAIFESFYTSAPDGEYKKGSTGVTINKKNTAEKGLTQIWM